MQDIFEKIKTAVKSDELLTLEMFQFLNSELTTQEAAIRDAKASLQQKLQLQCKFKPGDKVKYITSKDYKGEQSENIAFVSRVSFNSNGVDFGFLKVKKDGTASSVKLYEWRSIEQIEHV